MTRRERAPDHARNKVRKLLTVGERLPDRTRGEILALKGAAVAPLLGILGDDELAMRFAPGRGYAPMHAVWLLTELRVESAIESMLAVLAETEQDTILHDAIIQALPRFGAAVLEPTLRAYGDDRYGDCRDSLASILSALRIRDDRILAILREQLALDPELGASDLAHYGDPRALEDLVRAYDRYQIIDTDHPFANQALTEIRVAIEDLGGTLTPAQERKYVRAMERLRALAPAASRRASHAIKADGATRAARTQRSMLVRQRPEVQEVSPRRRSDRGTRRTSATVTAANDVGPIARKIIAAGRKQQRQQIVDLSTIRGARDEMRRIIDEAIPSSDIGDKCPGFAAYTYVTNWALGIVEATQDVRELGRHIDRIAKADEDYQPEGPPWSPIFLMGLPDIPESRPHSRVNEDRHLLGIGG